MQVNMQTLVPIIGLENVAKENGKIKGRVTRQGMKYPCQVSLHECVSRRLIEIKETDKNGFYEFANLSSDYRFMLIATDDSREFNAVIQDNVVPK